MTMFNWLGWGSGLAQILWVDDTRKTLQKGQIRSTTTDKLFKKHLLRFNTPTSLLEDSLRIPVKEIIC